MSTYNYEVNKQCPKCLKPIMGVGIKSPFIDDRQEGCANEECPQYVDLERILCRRESNEARAEEYQERESLRQRDRGDSDDEE